MKSELVKSTRSKAGAQAGQTLVVAMIVLALLLIVGLTFAGIINRTIADTRTQGRRTVSGDLAEAAVEFAHYQLLNSSRGADWRPEATPPDMDATGLSRDPDALYLRPASGFAYPGAGFADRGGPDGLGPYTRVNFDRGRGLVRVRYAPGDIAAITNPTGALRRPGRARNTIVIEALGRQGIVSSGGKIDPTRGLPEAVKVANYSDAADLEAGLSKVKRLDAGVVNAKKLVAFASIGIIESARFITNKYKVTRAADIGVPTGPGGLPIDAATQWGGTLVSGVAGTGSLWSNADLTLHGTHRVVMNKDLGDLWAVAGKISPANDQAELEVQPWSYDYTTRTWTQAPTQTLTGNALDSRNPGFNTVGGLLRDGMSGSDANGFVRGVRRKDPPSLLSVDPQDKRNRYLVLTRESGVEINGRNTGAYGWGRGVYVDAPERANTANENDRARQGAVRSLPTDWLNPNNANSLGWQGPFYRPLAPFLELLPDGFRIVRDSRSRRPFWADPATGASTGESSATYHLRRIGGRLLMLSDRVSSTFTDADFTSRGIEFNGVICFAGDLRVRGVIPTDVQLTVVSLGSIYLDGSITKGVVDFDGNVLGRPSQSMLMLMARDYVALNTTAFFGPAPGEDPKAKSSDLLPDTPSPLEFDVTESPQVNFLAQFLLRPNGANPSAWQPYGLGYQSAGTNDPIDPRLMISASADDGGPAFLGLDMAAQTYGLPGSEAPYLFPRTIDFGSVGTYDFNGASALFAGGTNIPLYGLANPAINAYPKFESVGFPLFGGKSYNAASRRIAGSAPTGAYELAVQDETRLALRWAGQGQSVPKNALVSRVAVTPHDVRIEAAIYAEEGSFFVIPGPWFNSNSQDTRSRFNADRSSIGLDQAQLRRFELYGSGPTTPFFGEPLAVRVSVVGAVSENMPASIGYQTEWLRKWGYIPGEMGGSGRLIPGEFVPAGATLNANGLVPNLIVSYDPALATASADGATAIREENGWVLPPMPDLPVSPTLLYFGEVNP